MIFGLFRTRYRKTGCKFGLELMPGDGFGGFPWGTPESAVRKKLGKPLMENHDETTRGIMYVVQGAYGAKESMQWYRFNETGLFDGSVLCGTLFPNEFDNCVQYVHSQISTQYGRVFQDASSPHQIRLGWLAGNDTQLVLYGSRENGMQDRCRVEVKITRLSAIEAPAVQDTTDERSFSEMSEWERLQHIQAQTLFEAGCQGALKIEELLRPLMENGSCRLPEANFRAGCLVHSFALVWTGISLRVPVEVGKPFMDAVIDSLAKEIDLRFGFEWSREQIEASVGRTWYELVNEHGSSGGQELFQMSKHILSYYLEDDKMGLDLALGLVVVMESIMSRGQKFFEALVQPV